MIKDDNMASWIATDYITLARFAPWASKDMDCLLENKFQGNDKVKDYNSKICNNRLTMCHLSVPEKLKDKRSDVVAHRECEGKVI